jgi:hypothetical protein
MRYRPLLPILVFLCLGVACSPRDFLTRRLAAALIAGSDTFKTPQQFWLRTGIISNKDYLSPDYLVLQRRGWITGANVPCSPAVAPPPCWDVALTPQGVETFRGLIPQNAPVSQYFSVQTAKRELIAVTGISKNGNVADVDFRWKWVPMNEVGAALDAGGVEYVSTVMFKSYDDGWRVMNGTVPAKSGEGLEDALKNATPGP